MRRTGMSETNRIEYKRELTPQVDIEKEVIAFLNSPEGGVIYIGVDKHGEVHGVADMDGDMLKIKDRLKHNIQPSCMGLFDVSSDEKDGKSIIRLTIASGSEKPYYKRKKSMTPDGCFIRIGTASEPMPQKMIDELYAKRTRNSLGKIKSNKQDLSFEQLKIYYQEKGKALNDQFANNLELTTESGDLNYVAYLMVDNNGTSIKVAKYDGFNRVDLKENPDYGYESLIKSAKQVLDKIDFENQHQTEITSKGRSDNRPWSPVALREAILNAFVHNDYTTEVPPKFEIFDDRIEITSTGGLPGGLSQAEFFEGFSVPRNKEIMRIFKDVGLVEQLGSGVPRILESYGKECFHFSDNFLRMSFPSSIRSVKQSRKDFGKISERIRKEFGKEISRAYEIICEHPEYTAEQIGDAISKSSRTVETYISKLKEAGYIVRKGPKLGGEWKILIDDE